MTALTMVKSGETDLRITRRFNARPQAVYDAHVDGEKMKRWMLGPPGWTMPHCDVDASEGGAFSYTWAEAESGDSFTIRGRFLTLDPPHRIEHEEQMDLPDGPTPMSRVVTVFEDDDSGTMMTMTISYDSAETREAVIASGMEEGMAHSYDNLDRLVAG